MAHQFICIGEDTGGFIHWCVVCGCIKCERMDEAFEYQWPDPSGIPNSLISFHGNEPACVERR